MPKASTLRAVGSDLNLGEMLRARRAEFDVAQEEFGAVVGVPWDQSRVSRYEAGRIPLDAADEVAAVLKLSVDEVTAAIRQRRRRAHQPRPVAERPGFEQRLTSLEQRVAALEETIYSAVLTELEEQTKQAREILLEELDDPPAAAPVVAKSTPVRRAARSSRR